MERLSPCIISSIFPNLLRLGPSSRRPCARGRGKLGSVSSQSRSAYCNERLRNPRSRVGEASLPEYDASARPASAKFLSTVAIVIGRGILGAKYTTWVLCSLPEGAVVVVIPSFHLPSHGFVPGQQHIVSLRPPCHPREETRLRETSRLSTFCHAMDWNE